MKVPCPHQGVGTTGALEDWCDDCLRRAGWDTILHERYAPHTVVTVLQVSDNTPLTHNPFAGLGGKDSSRQGL